jgi:uncharacterized protein (TIGR03118 family)
MRQLQRYVAVLLLGVVPATAYAQGFYRQTNLVSDGSVPAIRTDANLINPWGIVRGADTRWWVANNGTGTATVYDRDGVPQGRVVQLPSPSAGTPGAATGAVFNDTGGFVITDGSFYAPAEFLFATEDGTLLGWSANVAGGTQAIIAVDNSQSRAVYKGLTTALGGCGEPILYAANFRDGAVEMYDATFARIDAPYAFVDPNLPPGYAPFGIKSFGGTILVTYAQQDDARHDDVSGPGHGFVDAYDTSGNLIERVASRGSLNSPWGLAVAPGGFGPFGGDLLVGNFGDGKINAFGRRGGSVVPRGALFARDGQPIVIGDLWGIGFGNVGFLGLQHALFFAAGVADEAHGLFGSIRFVL